MIASSHLRPGPVVAVVGGGQLARMMQEEASALGIHLRALVEDPGGSTAQVCPDAPVGAAADAAAVRALLAGRCRSSAAQRQELPADVLTFEHEHQDTAFLEVLQAEGLSVQPMPQALVLAQDKLAMRRAMAGLGVPQPEWAKVSGSAQEIRERLAAFGGEHGWPIILKTPRGGYDGHGVLLVPSAQALTQAPASEWIETTADALAGTLTSQATGSGGSLGGGVVTSLLVERAVPFTRELAVLLARSPSGEVAVWPLAQTVQHEGTCVEVVAPAPDLAEETVEEALRIGRTVVERCGVTGVLAVELLAVEVVGEPTRLYVNELATRPHNSGHWTQDGAVTSQFAQHLRAVLDLPLGSTALTAPVTVMVNLLGGPREPGPDALARAMALEPEARVHLYGKEWRQGRKLGHVSMTCALAEDLPALRERARAVVAVLRGEEPVVPKGRSALGAPDWQTDRQRDTDAAAEAWSQKESHE